MYVSGLYDSEGHDEEQQVALAYVATEATCISPICVEMVKWMHANITHIIHILLPVVTSQVSHNQTILQYLQ